MDLKSLLDQMVESGKGMAQKGQTMAEQKLNIPAEGEKRDAMYSGLKTGAVATGILALLLGTKTGRAVGGTAAKLGGIAAVGGLAYQMYQKWQRGELGGSTKPAGEMLLEQTAPVQETRLSPESLLKVMIAAAKADGNVDEEELAAIRTKLAGHELSSDLNNLILQEMVRPLNVIEVAALANDDKAAAIEVYLVSRLVIDEENEAETRYLAELQQALGLPDELINGV